VPNPFARFLHAATETLVTFYRPFDETPVKQAKNPHQVVFPKLAKIVQPASNLRIECIRYTGDFTMCPAMDQ